MIANDICIINNYTRYLFYTLILKSHTPPRIHRHAGVTAVGSYYAVASLGVKQMRHCPGKCGAVAHRDLASKSKNANPRVHIAVGSKKLFGSKRYLILLGKLTFQPKSKNSQSVFSPQPKTECVPISVEKNLIRIYFFAN